MSELTTTVAISKKLGISHRAAINLVKSMDVKMKIAGRDVIDGVPQGYYLLAEKQFEEGLVKKANKPKRKLSEEHKKKMHDARRKKKK